MQNAKIASLFFLLHFAVPAKLSACSEAGKPIKLWAGEVEIKMAFAGERSAIIDGPSHESFEVILEPWFPTERRQSLV
jgi:hypothetical protein